MPDNDDTCNHEWPESGFDTDEVVRKSAPKTVERRPTPRMPPSWGPPSATVLASAERAFDTCASYMKSHSVDRNELGWLRREMLKVTREYWADKKYDDQLTSSALKKELRLIGNNLKRFRGQIENLSPTARMAIDSKLKRHSEGTLRVQGFADLTDLLRAFGIVVERSTDEIDAVKTGITAISKCSRALRELWKRTGGKKNLGARFAEKVCRAIDPELTDEQVAWRGKKAVQAL